MSLTDKTSQRAKKMKSYILRAYQNENGDSYILKQKYIKKFEML
jgi:hypothetical protein